jgi:multifunctional 2-oxoglutarate metabolism enzyme
MVERSSPEDFGANSWLVEEMYERYRDEPENLSVAWRDFFSDYKPVGTPKADPTGELIRPSFDSSPEVMSEGFSASVAATIAAPAVAATKLKPKSETTFSDNSKSAIRDTTRSSRARALAWSFSSYCYQHGGEPCGAYCDKCASSASKTA